VRLGRTPRAFPARAQSGLRAGGTLAFASCEPSREQTLFD